MHPRLVTKLAGEVRRGLTDPVRKWLPAEALYDDVGSALFEAITALPEYGLTRADVRLLKHCSPDVGRLSRAATVVELGSGSGVMTRLLLSAFSPDVVYAPVDVSRAALDRCVAELAGFVVQPVQDEFLPGLHTAVARRGAGPLLVCFLGSNIGNFERDAILPFLRNVRAELRSGDTLLLGADLVKPVDQLLLAYDDPAGVTAAFNRNLLARLNREFNGNFSLRCFEHEALWNAKERRIEMHLRSRSRQHVHIGDLDLHLTIEAGETIWTESSHKFEVAELTAMAGQAGLAAVDCWIDYEWPFAEHLLRVV
jgi:dimethylhistidine N-methyltransferase